MKVLVINGPNLNMLARRDPSTYGGVALSTIQERMADRGKELELEVDFFQSNHEGAIVDYIQEAAPGADAIVINGGALTHYGLSIRDALVDARLPIVEVHLSNIHAREEFRHDSVVAPIAIGQIAGLSWHGYIYALEFLAAHLAEDEE